ncbi:MAG: HAMP domain-containing histidine kinase [Opitutae bacterium]|nr:HAMP domain-containing histidine kinase [Opitutae bacterium]
MKLSPPLWIKVWLLLAVNFALLATLGAAWFFARSERGWERIALGPLGDRVAAIADDIADRLWSAPPEEAAAVLDAEASERGVDFLWLRNDGLVLAGPSLPLPAPVRDELRRRGPLDAEMRGGRPPEDDVPRPRGERLPPGQLRGGPGRFLFRVDGSYWFGLRLHPAPEQVREDDLPPRTTLVIRARSTWSFARLLGLHWWVGVAAGALGLSVLFWLPFVRSITRRLDALTAATDRLAEGKFATRAPVGGADEIGRLGGAINGMAQRLESHAEAQKRFLGDVAHELGSPLGRLQVAVELLEQRAPGPLQPAVADVREEVQQMAELVGELLAFTRAGLQAPAAARAPVPLAPLVAEALARENADGRVAVGVPADLVVLGDAALLRRAIGNLVRNALRYGGGAVRVDAERVADRVLVRVDDDGPGVPPEALARLGEPFFRPESARARDTGGVGLGLTIVRSSAAACGGEVIFANREPRGFRAELRLAAAE